MTSEGSPPIRSGDRFRLLRDFETHVLTVWQTPWHTGSASGTVPAGTVVVALDQQPDAALFMCYPEAYEDLEQRLVPDADRDNAAYQSYYLAFASDAVGEDLEPLQPLSPRPPNRLPRHANA